MNNCEAVTGFVSWLTTRKEPVTMGSNNDCAPVAELLKEYCEANDLGDVSAAWPDVFVMPGG